MKNKILILTMGILSLFWNCKDSKKEDFKVNYPEENLGVIKAKYSDGSLAIGAFNRGYKDYKEKSNYPWSLKINMELNSEKCNPNGLPLDDESELANKLENELVENLSKISPVHNVGHLFNSNHLDIYLYVRNKNKIDEWLKREIKKENLIRSFSYELTKDKNWETTGNFMNDK
ncbi:DUF695 domain-containing protein [Candidatus Marifrigoribacter sp. Uisw_064]|jgi:hypothetical protein|uniref:DUF695 domain-containing protein n=1 Tax=Candidatus Marifrigoribacter sp. Uisw_064 TaxID=3230970 RepID=UPI003D4AE464